MSEHPLPSSIAPRGASARNESRPESNRYGRIERAPSSHLVSVLAAELGIAPHRIGAAVALLDADNSVPFIARYRKEATGALTDTQLRAIQTRLGQLRALEERRARVLEALTARADEGLIDPLTLLQLRSSLMNAATVADVNALYAPYRSERVTRAQLARAAGLDSLVEDLLEVPLADAHAIAAAYITTDEEIAEARVEGDETLPIRTAEEALEGARAILIDRALTDPVLGEKLLTRLREQGVIESRVIAGQESTGAKFSDYFAFSDRIRSIPPHRVLALHRAKDAGVVRLKVDVAPAPAPLSRLRGAARAEAERAVEIAEHAPVADTYEAPAAEAHEEYEAPVAEAQPAPAEQPVEEHEPEQARVYTDASIGAEDEQHVEAHEAPAEQAPAEQHAEEPEAYEAQGEYTEEEIAEYVEPIHNAGDAPDLPAEREEAAHEEYERQHFEERREEEQQKPEPKKKGFFSRFFGL